MQQFKKPESLDTVAHTQTSLTKNNNIENISKNKFLCIF